MVYNRALLVGVSSSRKKGVCREKGKENKCLPVERTIACTNMK